MRRQCCGCEIETFTCSSYAQCFLEKQVGFLDLMVTSNDLVVAGVLVGMKARRHSAVGLLDGCCVDVLGFPAALRGDAEHLERLSELVALDLPRLAPGRLLPRQAHAHQHLLEGRVNPTLEVFGDLLDDACAFEIS